MYVTTSINLAPTSALLISFSGLQVAYYGIALNTAKFFYPIGFAHSTLTANDTVESISASASQNAWALQDITPRAAFTDFLDLCKANLIFSGAGLLPGYWVTFLLIDRLGRKKIQVVGFCVLVILFAILGVQQ